MHPTKQCYMCNLPYLKPERWSPDGAIKIERLHCSKQCYRMYKIAYMSDQSLRVEHSIRRAQDELLKGTHKERASYLRRWIRELRNRLTHIKRANKVRRLSAR
jgi:hypothetical protein